MKRSEDRSRIPLDTLGREDSFFTRSSKNAREGGRSPPNFISPARSRLRESLVNRAVRMPAYMIAKIYDRCATYDRRGRGGEVGAIRPERKREIRHRLKFTACPGGII